MTYFEKFFESSELWGSIIVVAVACIICIFVKKAVHKYLKHNEITGKRATNAHVTVSAIRYITLIFAVIAILQINGVNVSFLVTSLGVVGIVVGFALQDILKDLIMGFNIVNGHFFEIGDTVRYKDIVGIVKGFDLKVTKIFDVNSGSIFTVCNRNISEIEKLSEWFYLAVPTGYYEDFSKMRTAFSEIAKRAKELPDVNDCKFLGTDKFGESAVEYKLCIYCKPNLRLRVRREVLGLIQEVYKEKNITFPYSHLDINLKKE